MTLDNSFRRALWPVAALLLAACGPGASIDATDAAMSPEDAPSSTADAATGAAPDAARWTRGESADAGISSANDASAPAPACASLHGAAMLLPNATALTGPNTVIDMVPDLDRDGVVLAPAMHPGPWTAQRDMLQPGHDSEAFYLDDWLYVLGGSVNSQVGESVLQTAPVLADGTLGPWQFATPFAFGIIDHQIRVSAGRAYLTGGAQSFPPGQWRQQVHSYMAVPHDGDVPQWTRQTDNPVRRFGFDEEIANGFVYTSAGDDGFDATDDVSFAPIEPDGTLGEWVRATPLPFGPLQFHAGFVTSRHLYVMGGCLNKICTDATHIERRILRAEILASGALGPWVVAGELPGPNFDFGVNLVGGRVILTGGRPGGWGVCHDIGGDNYVDTWWADLLPDGSLGPWQGGPAGGAQLPRPRSDHTAVYDPHGRLFIAGGRTSCLPGETTVWNETYAPWVWQSTMVRDTGVARVGSWLSGPLAVPAGVIAPTIRWSSEGAGITARVRGFDGVRWGDWSAPSAAPQLAVPAGATQVQVLVEATSDGVTSPVLHSVDLSCSG